ncbi:HAMP domain-containing sensor histidine kinase [Bacillus sp. FJAT-50079]|uniref:sensor histidine kinase n=1 Tax=Bacillus sp. FJAT-50079 TaxID=2833577 RepID=UPI001BCA41D4|nr:HAMP domain-containing sensor histidine kinase [Bacillus sp. FJAT-50079]MBS4207233.1 HAMP domain-containing histidine kinase [Bacillus sp. FJAT-50079]
MGIKNTFSAYFVKSIIKLCFVGLLILMLNIWFVLGGINNHLLIPANEPIKKAENIQSEIVNADYIDFNIIPSELDYAIFNKQTNEMIRSNMSSRNNEKAKEAFRNSSKDERSSFIRYDSKNEAILIYYNLKVQFANVELRKVFPNPGVWLSILSILTYCIYIVWNIRSFSRVIIQENQKLINVARKIEEKDLNIEFPQVRFNEYKDVMGAMESLSEALVKSIQKEIEVTNSKAEQISYLIHDIKIPLTVIKGNTELLEMMITDDMKENFSDIMDSVQQIERYIQEVIDINLNNKQINTDKEEVAINDFLYKLEAEVKSLSNNIVVEDFTENGTRIFIDVNLLIRAINNVVLNGIERTPQDKKVQLSVRQDKDFIQFIISDQGPGFSKEALKKGSELFYTENDGRTNNSHYGLGLTFTEKVIKQHNGRIRLSNNADHSGEVLVELPVLKLEPEKELIDRS